MLVVASRGTAHTPRDWPQARETGVRAFLRLSKAVQGPPTATVTDSRSQSVNVMCRSISGNPACNYRVETDRGPLTAACRLGIHPIVSFPSAPTASAFSFSSSSCSSSSSFPSAFQQPAR
jgi:hypothetical protein